MECVAGAGLQEGATAKIEQVAEAGQRMRVQRPAAPKSTGREARAGWKFFAGAAFLVAFAVWTALVLNVDVRPAGQGGTDIGFATLNLWFHELTGVHMEIYALTDWLGLVPVAVCLCFAGVGAVQLVKRGSLRRVDADILLLGVHYVAVACFYALFEVFPVNYRPVLIEGVLEASYPSSTTLLVLGVMPTLAYQMSRRMENRLVKGVAIVGVLAFSAFMVVGRLLCGVHWMTDVIGSVLLASGLFMMYWFAVDVVDGSRRVRARKGRHGVRR